MYTVFAAFAGIGLGVLIWYLSIISPDQRASLFRPRATDEVSAEEGWKNVMQTLVDDIESVHQEDREKEIS